MQYGVFVGLPRGVGEVFEFEVNLFYWDFFKNCYPVSEIQQQQSEGGINSHFLYDSDFSLIPHQWLEAKP